MHALRVEINLPGIANSLRSLASTFAVRRVKRSLEQVSPIPERDGGIFLSIAGCVKDCTKAARRDAVELHVDKGTNRGWIAARVRY